MNGVTDILKTSFIHSAAKQGLENGFIFQQDADPKHTSQIVKLCLLYYVQRQLHTHLPSPALSYIEHLWDLLKPIIRDHNISSKEMIKYIINQYSPLIDNKVDKFQSYGRSRRNVKDI